MKTPRTGRTRTLDESNSIVHHSPLPLLAPVGKPHAAFVPTAYIKGATSSVRIASHASTFAGATQPSLSATSIAGINDAISRNRAKAVADGVRGLKAVAMAETAGVVGGTKVDKMGEYIASRGGSRAIRKVYVCFVRNLGRKVVCRFSLDWSPLLCNHYSSK